MLALSIDQASVLVNSRKPETSMLASPGSADSTITDEQHMHTHLCWQALMPEPSMCCTPHSSDSLTTSSTELHPCDVCHPQQASAQHVLQS